MKKKTTTKAATEEQLKDLHRELAKVMLQQLKSKDESLKPSFFNVVRAFLNDNGIKADQTKEDLINGLEHIQERTFNFDDDEDNQEEGMNDGADIDGFEF